MILYASLFATDAFCLYRIEELHFGCINARESQNETYRIDNERVAVIA